VTGSRNSTKINEFIVTFIRSSSFRLRQTTVKVIIICFSNKLEPKEEMLMTKNYTIIFSC